jgi:hypothetical protein
MEARCPEAMVLLVGSRVGRGEKPWPGNQMSP